MRSSSISPRHRAGLLSQSPQKPLQLAKRGHKSHQQPTTKGGFQLRAARRYHKPNAPAAAQFQLVPDQPCSSPISYMVEGVFCTLYEISTATPVVRRPALKSCCVLCGIISRGSRASWLPRSSNGHFKTLLGPGGGFSFRSTVL